MRGYLEDKALEVVFSCLLGGYGESGSGTGQFDITEGDHGYDEDTVDGYGSGRVVVEEPGVGIVFGGDSDGSRETHLLLERGVHFSQFQENVGRVREGEIDLDSGHDGVEGVDVVEVAKARGRQMEDVRVRQEVVETKVKLAGHNKGTP